eukprot:443873_1
MASVELFQNEIECNDKNILKCHSAKRIRVILSQYSNILADKNTTPNNFIQKNIDSLINNKLGNAKYSNTKLLNDFHHLKHYHDINNDNKQFEIMYNYLLENNTINACAMNSCSTIKRHYRNKNTQTNIQIHKLPNQISNDSKPQSISECDLNEIIHIILNDDLIDQINRLKLLKLNIIEFIKENKFDGHKLVNTTRKEFINELATHLNVKKLRGHIGKLYLMLINYDMAKFAQPVNAETESKSESATSQQVDVQNTAKTESLHNRYAMGLVSRIHVFFMHSYSINKLTIKEINQIEAQSNDNKDEDDGDFENKKLAMTYKIMQQKVQKSSTFVGKQNSKYIETTITQVTDENDTFHDGLNSENDFDNFILWCEQNEYDSDAINFDISFENEDNYNSNI